MPNDWSEQSVPLTKHCKLQDINNATNKYVMAITLKTFLHPPRV